MNIVDPRDQYGNKLLSVKDAQKIVDAIEQSKYDELNVRLKAFEDDQKRVEELQKPDGTKFGAKTYADIADWTSNLVDNAKENLHSVIANTRVELENADRSIYEKITSVYDEFNSVYVALDAKHTEDVNALTESQDSLFAEGEKNLAKAYVTLRRETDSLYDEIEGRVDDFSLYVEGKVEELSTTISNLETKHDNELESVYTKLESVYNELDATDHSIYNGLDERIKSVNVTVSDNSAHVDSVYDELVAKDESIYEELTEKDTSVYNELTEKHEALKAYTEKHVNDDPENDHEIRQHIYNGKVYEKNTHYADALGADENVVLDLNGETHAVYRGKDLALVEETETLAAHVEEIKSSVDAKFDSVQTSVYEEFASVHSELADIQANLSDVETALTSETERLEGVKLTYKWLETKPNVEDCDPNVVYLVKASDGSGDNSIVYEQWMLRQDASLPEPRLEKIGIANHVTHSDFENLSVYAFGVSEYAEGLTATVQYNYNKLDGKIDENYNELDKKIDEQVLETTEQLTEKINELQSQKIQFQVVKDLTADGKVKTSAESDYVQFTKNTIYLISVADAKISGLTVNKDAYKSNADEVVDRNLFLEYMAILNVAGESQEFSHWELIGSTETDLSEYYKKVDVDGIRDNLEGEISKTTETLTEKFGSYYTKGEVDSTLKTVNEKVASNYNELKNTLYAELKSEVTGNYAEFSELRTNFADHKADIYAHVNDGTLTVNHNGNAIEFLKFNPDEDGNELVAYNANKNGDLETIAFKSDVESLSERLNGEDERLNNKYENLSGSFEGYKSVADLTLYAHGVKISSISAYAEGIRVDLETLNNEVRGGYFTFTNTQYTNALDIRDSNVTFKHGDKTETLASESFVSEKVDALTERLESHETRAAGINTELSKYTYGVSEYAIGLSNYALGLNGRISDIENVVGTNEEAGILTATIDGNTNKLRFNGSQVELMHGAENYKALAFQSDYDDLNNKHGELNQLFGELESSFYSYGEKLDEIENEQGALQGTVQNHLDDRLSHVVDGKISYKRGEEESGSLTFVHGEVSVSYKEDDGKEEVTEYLVKRSQHKSLSDFVESELGEIKEEISDIEVDISSLKEKIAEGLHLVVVEELDTDGYIYLIGAEKQRFEKNAIYLITVENAIACGLVNTDTINEKGYADEKQQNKYLEYVAEWSSIGDAAEGYDFKCWELIGSTETDLSNYYDKGEVDSTLKTVNEKVASNYNELKNTLYAELESKVTDNYAEFTQLKNNFADHKADIYAHVNNGTLTVNHNGNNIEFLKFNPDEDGNELVAYNTDKGGTEPLAFKSDVTRLDEEDVKLNAKYDKLDKSLTDSIEDMKERFKKFGECVAYEATTTLPCVEGKKVYVKLGGDGLSPDDSVINGEISYTISFKPLSFEYADSENVYFFENSIIIDASATENETPTFTVVLQLQRYASKADEENKVASTTEITLTSLRRGLIYNFGIAFIKMDEKGGYFCETGFAEYAIRQNS